MAGAIVLFVLIKEPGASETQQASWSHKLNTPTFNRGQDLTNLKFKI
jgi:hypothetical protein